MGMIRKALEKQSDKVESGFGGGVALQQLVNQNHDIAIADIKMLDMSGKQRLREIKEGYPHMAGRVVALPGTR